MRYCIMSNDGRYVTQQGAKPALTANPNLAYVWSDSEAAKAMLGRYLEALKDKGILMLAVFPLHLEYKRGAIFGKVAK